MSTERETEREGERQRERQRERERESRCMYQRERDSEFVMGRGRE